jgi:DNA-binding GntR family transcriptional regulator
VESASDPNIEAIVAYLRQADLLDPAELRELLPSLLILEALAVRDSPPFDAEAIAGLRAANERLRDSAGDAVKAADADDEFHRRLTARCDNPQLLEVAAAVRKGLLDYEREYMLSPERLSRSVDQHEAIVAALEQGDHMRAAERVRVNFTTGMPTSQTRFPQQET